MSRRVLILEDDESLRLVISKALSRAGFEVRSTASVETAVARMASNDADALVADVLLGRENFLDHLDDVKRLRPDAPVIVMSAQTTAKTALGASRAGAFEYLPKPFDLNELVHVLKVALKLDVGGRARNPVQAHGLIGQSDAMQIAFRAMARLAGTRDPVLILGRSGSGRATFSRELARAHHDAPDLTSVGPSQLDREPGFLRSIRPDSPLLFRRAEEWSEAAQANLLEWLEDTEANPSPVFVTGLPDLDQRIRKDLFERLAIGLIRLPPVRDRGGDRALLFESFLFGTHSDPPTLTSKAIDYVNSQVWPGEVAQIRRIARHIANQGARGPIEVDAIAGALSEGGEKSAGKTLEMAGAEFFAMCTATDIAQPAERAQLHLEAGLFKAALEASAGVRIEAARRLGMNRNTFARRLELLRLEGLL